MADVRIKKSFGPQGLADVRILKDAVRIHFEEGDTYDLPLEAWQSERPQGRYNVTLNTTKDKVLGARPQPGVYILRFKRVGNRVFRNDGKPNDPGYPSSKIIPGGPRQSADGKKHWIADSEVIWVAEFEVLESETNGIYGGLTATTNLPYSFARPAVGDITSFEDSKRNMERLEKFFMVATRNTLADVDIPYSDNSTELLLRFERFLVENGKPFMGKIGVKGFIDLDELSPIPTELLPRDLRKPTAKKKAAKKK